MGKVDTNANLNFFFIRKKKQNKEMKTVQEIKGIPYYTFQNPRELNRTGECRISGHENHMLRGVNTFCIHYLEKKKNIQNS